MAGYRALSSYEDDTSGHNKNLIDVYGQEFAQEREWSEKMLDWNILI